MEPYRGVEPRWPAWKADVLPLDQYGTVGPAGIEPAYAGLRPAANPSQLETLGRETGTRTPSTWSQARRAYPHTTSWSGPAESNRVSPDSESGRLPSSSIPFVPRYQGAARWRWRESNPLRRRLQGVSATSAVIPMGRCGARYSQSPGVAFFRRIAKFGRHGGLPFMVLTLWRCQ